MASMKNKSDDIQAVIFDLGRVLVAIDNTLLVEKLFKGMDGGNPQELGRRTMSDPAMIAFNTGQIGLEEFHRRMCRTFRLTMDINAFKSLWCEIFYTMDGMKELVGRVSKKTKVGLLSDTDPLHWSFISSRWP
jgi:hypothetical protein